MRDMPPAEAFPFTVVIPVYNRPADARACLSAFTRPEAAGIEVIVVDDGSRDDTPEVVEAVAAESRGAHIRLIRQANGGPGAARNTGVAAATTPWIVFLDSDDLWLPWTAGILRETLSAPEAEKAGILFFATQYFRDPAELERIAPAALVLRRHATMLDLRLGDPLPVLASCNLAIRREAFLALGGFTTLVRHGEDTDLLYRANMLGEAWTIPAPVMMGYRVGNDSLSKAGSSIRNRRMRFILERYRAGLYPGPEEKLARAIGRSVAFTIRAYFREGYPGPAYRVYGQGFRALRRAGDWGALAKLPFTPVLHYLRPKNYAFRWRPKA